MPAAAVSARDLCRSFVVPVRQPGIRHALRSLLRRETRTVRAVESVTFEIATGEVVGFLGPNGAGKTTTIKMLAGLLHPTSGAVSALGHQPARRDADYLRRIALLMGNRRMLTWDLPALDSYELRRAIYGIPTARFLTVRDDLIDRFEIADLVTKPVRNVQLFVTARELSVWDLSGVTVGGGVVVFGASRAGGVGAVDVVAFLMLLPVGLAIVYGFFLAVTSLAFRLVDINDFLFRLFQGASYAGRWPLGVYSGWLRVVLTAIVPIGVAVTIPSSALAGRLSGGWLAAGVAAGVAALVISRWVFLRGIRSYAGASA